MKRKNNYENETYLKVQASYSSIDSKNTITIQYQFKKTTESSYSTLANLSNNTQITLEFINEKPIDVPDTLSNISKLVILLAATGVLIGAITIYKNKFSEDGIE